MKIAVVRPSRELVHMDSNINGREALALYDILEEAGHEVTLMRYNYTKPKRVGFLPPKEKIRNIATYSDIPDPNVFDLIFMASGSINFYGGVVDETITAAYHYVSLFKGKVLYLMTDVTLPFKQEWKYVRTKDYIDFDKDYCWIDNDIRVISHFKDTDDVLKLNQKHWGNVTKAVYFPFSRWIITNTKYAKNTGEYDLVYGGLFRTANAKKGFEKYYIDSKLKSYLFGTTTEDLRSGGFGDVSHIEFGERVKPDKVIETNTKGLCTVVLGTPHCDDSAVTLRVFESILSNCVTFIDEPFDSSHFIFGDFDFLYVNSTEELVEKVKRVREDEEFRQQVLAEQHKFIDRCKEQNLPELMNEAIKEALSD